MTFSGLFAIGLSGVNAQAASLEAVSQNIANTQTAGYKRARVDFSTLVTSLSPEGGLEGGGVDARQRTLFSEQGAIARTNSATDIAIAGEGFFVVSRDAAAGSALSLTRSGGFDVDADGALRNAAGFVLRAAPISGAGTAGVGALSALEAVNINRIPALAAATGEIALAGNLSDAGGTQFLQVFDSDGAARTILVAFAPAGPGQFDARIAFADGDAAVIAQGAVVFGADGRLDQSATSLPLSFNAGADQPIDLDISSLTFGPGTTQFTTARADGAALGTISGVEIASDGKIIAQFSNGLTRDIYQLALVNVVNAEGLEEGESSTFRLTENAGRVSLDIPQTGRAGAIEGRALEISTVDIGQEFSTLIETQRAYAANTRVISIADELWRTLGETAR